MSTKRKPPNIPDYTPEEAAEVEAKAMGDLENPPRDVTRMKRARGRPAGETKASISLRLDKDVAAWFKASGKGYQTRINAILRDVMEKAE